MVFIAHLNHGLNQPTLGRTLICQDVSTHCKKDTNPTVLKSLFLCHFHQNHHSEYHIYTDGSKTENGVAFSVVTENRSISKKTTPFVFHLHC